MIQGKNIRLRALEPGDLEFLYEIENNTELWEVSATQIPFSKYILEQYIENAYKDIYEAKQLRLVIENKSGENLGLIDIFDFDPKNRRASLGIVICSNHRGRGYASEAVDLICNYAIEFLNLHQLYVNIGATNEQSIGLFQKLGFVFCGEKKDWNFHNGRFTDEKMFQRILE